MINVNRKLISSASFSGIAAIYFLLAMIFLMLGAVYYLTFRPNTINSLLGYTLLPLATTKLSGWGGLAFFNSLPTFIHGFAFSCLSAAFIGFSRKNIVLLAIFWLLINVVFEWAQSLSVNNPNFIIHGYFDSADILAAIAAALLFIVLGEILLRIKQAPIIIKSDARLLQIPILVSGVFLICASAPTCEEQPAYCYNFGAEPVYMSYVELRGAIKASKDHPLTKTGKIYVYGNLLLVNTPNQGIHVYDNTDNTRPVHRAYINIPGNLDIAVKNGYLYVDSYIDLVTIDIRDLDNITEVDRELQVFPYDPYQNIPQGVYLGPVDPKFGVVVGYKKG